MDVFFAGRKSESGLKSVVRGAGHRVVKDLKGADAVVWSDAYGRAKAVSSLTVGVPVFYAGDPAALTRKAGGFDNSLLLDGLLYVPYLRRGSGPFSALAGQVRAGAVGDAGFIRIHSNQPFPKGTGAPLKRGTYGVVWSSLIHDIDWLQREFGPIRKVFAQGVQKARPKLEYAMATYTMKSGLIAQVIHSYQSHGESVVRAEICGTSGIVQYDSSQKPIRLHGGLNVKSADEPGLGAAWSEFELLASKRSVSKKVRTAFSDPVRIADLTAQSLRTGKAYKA